MRNEPTNGTAGNRDPVSGDLLQDLMKDAVVQLGPGERLWKLFIFRPASGRSTGLEHRIYAKLKPNGRLALVTFAVHSPREGRLARSGIAQVPEISEEALDQVIQAVRRETRSGPEEYEEIDLSGIESLTEQLEYLRQL
jgi:hypothetical protein